MKNYRDDFMPLSIYNGFCSLTTVLGVLNYFFGVNFGAKDNWDIFGLVKYGRQSNSDLLGISEMALFFDRLYLNVTLYTEWSKEDSELYNQVNDHQKIELLKKYIPVEDHQYIQGTKRVFGNGRTLDLLDNLVTDRVSKSDIKFIHQFTKDQIIQHIKDNQNLADGGVIFVLGLNHSLLYDKEFNSNAGHVVITTGVDENNNFVIHEPLSPRPNPHLIPVDRVMSAIFESKPYEILMIKENPNHITPDSL